MPVTPVSTNLAVADAITDMSWAVAVTTAEGSGELVPNPTATPVWARPALSFGHIATATGRMALTFADGWPSS